MEDMSLTEYFERLNLSKYLNQFNKMKVNSIFDLRHLTEEKIIIEEYPFMEDNDRKRLLSLVKKDVLSKTDFNYLTAN